MSLVTTQNVKRSDIFAGKHFIYPENVLEQTLKSFNTKFRHL